MTLASHLGDNQFTVGCSAEVGFERIEVLHIVVKLWGAKLRLQLLKKAGLLDVVNEPRRGRRLLCK